jgi:hypothetical protein
LLDLKKDVVVEKNEATDCASAASIFLDYLTSKAKPNSCIKGFFVVFTIQYRRLLARADLRERTSL